MPRGPSGRPHGGLTTTGRGTVTVVPDLAVVTFGAEAVETDPAVALTRATEALGRLRDSLLGAGVDAEDLRTTGTTSWTDPGTVDPTDPAGSRPARTTVHLTVEAVLRDTATAGRVAQDAVLGAGPCARLEGTTFAVCDPARARREARDLAWADAVAAAEQLATLAGRPLGRVVDVREEGEPGPGPRAFAARAVGLELDPGRTTVTVTLVVRHTWADVPGGHGRDAEDDPPPEIG